MKIFNINIFNLHFKKNKLGMLNTIEINYYYTLIIYYCEIILLYLIINRPLDEILFYDSNNSCDT